MKTSSLLSRLLATAAIGVALASGCATPTFAADINPAQMKQEWVKHHQDMRAEHFKKAATHLGITPAQEKEWQAFTDALNTMSPQLKHPEANADAASIARFHADMAAEHAKKLNAIADATSKLQASLTPEQRKTFNEMAHRFSHRHQHGRHHHWHHHGHHGHDHHNGWGHDGQWQHSDGKEWHRDGHGDHQEAPAK